MSATVPIGSAQSTLIQRRPTRTRRLGKAVSSGSGRRGLAIHAVNRLSAASRCIAIWSVLLLLISYCGIAGLA